MPFTSDTIGWFSFWLGSIFSRSQSASLMPNAENAIFDRNATSGVHRSNTTVVASVALIFLMLPV